MNAPPPRFLRHALTMQQNLGRMMADLAVAEGEEVEGNGSPKKKESKIIKKKVRFDRVLSNSALRLHPPVALGSGFSAGFGMPGRRSVPKVRGIVSRVESTYVEVRRDADAHTYAPNQVNPQLVQNPF